MVTCTYRTWRILMRPYDDRTLRTLFINQVPLSGGLILANTVYEVCNGLLDHERLAGDDLHGHPDAVIADVIAFALFGQALCTIVRPNEGGSESEQTEEMLGMLRALHETVEDVSELLVKVTGDPDAFVVAACIRLVTPDGGSAICLYRNKSLTSEEARGYLKQKAVERLAKAGSAATPN